MTRGIVFLAFAVATAAGALDAQTPPGRAASPPAGPVLVMDTAKGTVEIQLFPADAPKSVEHILTLARGDFYRGLRLHRVERSLVQWGDPTSRDVSKKAYWGSRGSGNPIGVAEFSKRRTHQRGAVALAHAGRAELADSQLYIMKAASPGLDGKHTVIGQVSAGMAVVDRLAVGDVIKNISVK